MSADAISGLCEAGSLEAMLLYVGPTTAQPIRLLSSGQDAACAPGGFPETPLAASLISFTQADRGELLSPLGNELRIQITQAAGSPASTTEGESH